MCLKLTANKSQYKNLEQHFDEDARGACCIFLVETNYGENQPTEKLNSFGLKRLI
jgi:hypothetical protein